MYDNPWIVPYKKNPAASLRMICFPYAGGGASFCRAWGRYLPDDVELISVQLPGREQRFMEEAFTRMAPLVNQLSDVMQEYLNKPFVFFGHSMGAVIGYEVIRRLRNRACQQPGLFIVSGRQAPQIPDKGPAIHHLPDDQFCIEFLRRNFSAKLKAVLENAELKDLFLPQIKADVELIETYSYTEEDPLDCPIVAFNGADDTDVIITELQEWAGQTTREFRSYIFPGGHFFIESAEPQVLAAIRGELHGILQELTC